MAGIGVGAASAGPEPIGIAGDRSFHVDETGVLRFSTTWDRPPTRDSAGSISWTSDVETP
jgi:hypothetical protein